jgi:short subunit dehydrogenase-like uncharacterized protein
MLLVFGSYGYTGRLVVREALARGVDPVLAGRREEAVRGHAEAARGGKPLAWRAFRADAPDLRGVRVVLNCAGPFVDTAETLARACVAAGVHYVDVTGEIPVFEALARMDAAARLAGTTVLPGAGFDVVPTDCLAAHLKRRLPTATRLELAISGSGGISHGTLTTMVRGLGLPGAVRADGALTPEPVGKRTRTVDFGGDVRRRVVSIPWGDVSTAWHSTGIPSIVTYVAVPAGMALAAPGFGALAPALGLAPVKAFVQRRVDARAPGPSDEARAKGWSRCWGRVEDDAGGSAEARLLAPEGYTLTAAAAVDIALRAGRGELPAGFQTPSRALGPDYVTGLAGVSREDL